MTTNGLIFDLQELRHKWGWFLALGISLVIIGMIALGMIPVATLAAVMVLGWLLVLSGIMEAIQGFQVHRWSGMFLHLAGGILGVLIGLLIVTHPVAGALAWTLLFASFFAVIGLFRLIAAIRLKFPHWRWAAFDGIVTLLLGVLLGAGWPWSGLWFLGLAVGLSLILRGWSQIVLALTIRSMAVPIEIRRAA